MKNKTFLYFLFFSASIFFSGCSTTSFLPQTHTVPLFTDKKQLYISSSLNTRTFDFQAAYSPINHLGIITDMQIASRYTMAEIGIGVFQPYGEHLVTELYAGYGNGLLKVDYDKKVAFLSYDYNSYNIDINANKYFLQPNFGIKFTEKISLSFSTKFIYWDYSHYKYYHEKWNYDSGSYYMASSDSLTSARSSAMTIEPSATFKVGGEHTKFMLQAGFSPILTSGGVDFLPYRNTYGFIRFGVCVNFDLFNKKE